MSDDKIIRCSTAKYAFVMHTFNATRTVWSDDERFIEGYDGVHRTTLHVFDSKEERDKELEDLQVLYGEDDGGSYCKTLWVGAFDSLSTNSLRVFFSEEVGK